MILTDQSWRSTHILKVSVFLLALLVSTIALGDTLTGTVVGKDGKPKPGVSVDVLGSSNVFTETDQRGGFSVTLRPGSYVIRIRDGRNRMEFPTQVPAGVNPVQLKLTW